MNGKILERLYHNLRYLGETGQLDLSRKDLQEIIGRKRILTLEELIGISTECGVPVAVLLETQMGKRFAAIRMLVMDCDGVLTDGGMIFTKGGDEIKRFNSRDGLGIKRTRESGLITAILSSGISTGIVEKRGEMLGVDHVYVGKEPKLTILENWMRQHNFGFEEVAYIGDDLTDLPVLERVGLSACPLDAVRRVRQACKVVLQRKGGEGCVRELIDNYLPV